MITFSRCAAFEHGIREFTAPKSKNKILRSTPKPETIVDNGTAFYSAAKAKCDAFMNFFKK